MSQGRFVVPPIYQDHSDQGRGYFQFSFHCPECGYSVMTSTQRSTTATATRVMDLGVGLLGGFWGRAAEQGEQMFGTRWESEHDQALVKAWDEIKKDFRFCNQCKRTVCFRCWNPQVNLCTSCAPDLKADAAHFQHGLNIEAQRQQIEQNYHAPQFNTSAVPSAVTPDMVMPSQGHSGPMPQAPPGQMAPQIPGGQPVGQMAPQIPGGQPIAPVPPQAPSAASIAGFTTPGYPKQVTCPGCNTPGLPGKFCQNCGTKLPMPDLFCPKCATKVEATAHFCPECGERLAQ